MGTEHRFRDDRGVDVDAFDWATPAEDLQIPLDDARALHEEALRRAMYPGSRPAQELYLEWLAAWDPEEPLSDPGRHTLTMRLGQRHRREPARRSRVPGKRPLTAHLDGPRSFRAEAREHGAPREAQAPAPAQSSGWSWTLIEGGAQGAPLPGDVATRLGPHVGHEATRAARLHTDDTADQVAAAHRARAVAIGDAIYFARGEYAPGTARGDELLAHELTHVAQAQRGELSRAAAKGIDSGGTLDPAEAEAELRAKLAVIQLHAPAGAAPELAAPSGQPTSDGDRAAKLTAQQQRLDLVGADVLPDATETAVSDEIPQEPVAHPAPEMTAAPAPAAASSGNAYADTFDATPSEQAMELWAQAGTEATTQATAERAQFESGLAPLPVVLDGTEVPDAAGDGQAEHAPELSTEAGAAPPETELPPTPEPAPVTTATDAAEVVTPTATIEQIMAAVMGMFAAFPTTLPPDVPVDPGPAPVTDLSGQADPARALGDHQQAVGEGAAALETERESILAGPGAAQVQPVQLDEQLEVPALDAGEAMPELPSIEGMTKLQQWSLPAEVQASFDEVARPKMEASLAEAKVKMTEAQTQRDADRLKAVDDAHEKVKLAHEDADKQQQTKVAETRSQITNHQAQTLLKQEKEVKNLELQSGEKKKSTVGRIQERLQADQAQVETDYTDAKTRVDDEKRRGEEEVARKKQEAEDEANEDRSWWDMAADAICDAVQAIADEINSALEALGAAIGAILDEVKEAACQLIDAACTFVCDALTEFGDWLQETVTALLGEVFPELAAELNRLIDEAVTAATEAVTAIADGLKEAVTALCDGLKAAIEAAIAVFQAAVQAAATLMEALVTGDWSLVAQMVLDGILQALGIDPAAFYALIGSAQDSLEKIVEDPGAFVGHLIDAVKLGFEQFGTNFWTHLQAGVVEWLFGTFAEAGIQMPAQFDIAGIFDLVLQVLGLTWDRLRIKVVDLIGEENTQRLEFVAGYIEALITGGLAGLWEQVQQDLSNLWDMVIGGIQDWLIENVVQQAIVKIATMWNPVGAIIQLIQTAWNTYQWLAENAQRIFGLVQAVVDSIANIVAGDISGAANWIEQSLADLVPITISLFANLLGLGGLADHIRTVIEDVQDAVEEAIDALIARVMAMFRGDSANGGEDESEEEAPEEIGARVTFNVGDETHTQFIDPSSSEPMVASTPTLVKAKLDSMGTAIDALDQTTPYRGKTSKYAAAQAWRTDARSLADVVKREANTVKNGGGDTLLRTKQQELADLLLELFILTETNPAGPEGVRRIVYAAIGDARRQILANLPNQTDQEGSTESDASLRRSFDQIMSDAISNYNTACDARLSTNPAFLKINRGEHSENVFEFLGKSLFVDHQNNYILPDSTVSHSRAVMRGKFYVSSLTAAPHGPLTDDTTVNAQLQKDTSREDTITQFAYPKSGALSPSLGQIAQQLYALINGEGVHLGERDTAMTAAVLVAESRRNPNSHIFNQIMLSRAYSGQDPNTARPPMARGGTDNPGDRRDDALSGTLYTSAGPQTGRQPVPRMDQVIQLAPESVTTNEIALVTRWYEAAPENSGESIDEIVKNDADGARTKIADWLIRQCQSSPLRGDDQQ